MGFPNQSLLNSLPLFQDAVRWFVIFSLTLHQVSLKRIISYKSSLTDALICLPWLSLDDSTTLLFILFL